MALVLDFAQGEQRASQAEMEGQSNPGTTEPSQEGKRARHLGPSESISRVPPPNQALGWVLDSHMGEAKTLPLLNLQSLWGGGQNSRPHMIGAVLRDAREAVGV